MTANFRSPPLTNPTAHRGYLFLEVLRSTGEKEFPLHLGTVLLYVASHNGCRQQDVEKGASLSPSSVSRNVSWLGDAHRLGHRKALHLVERRKDLDDYKRWRLFLTPRGEQFVRLLEEQLLPPEADD